MANARALSFRSLRCTLRSAMYTAGWLVLE
jgi:hypothetical protein